MLFTKNCFSSADRKNLAFLKSNQFPVKNKKWLFLAVCQFPEFLFIRDYDHEHKNGHENGHGQGHGLR
jgi:hypothetical protein